MVSAQIFYEKIISKKPLKQKIRPIEVFVFLTQKTKNLEKPSFPPLGCAGLVLLKQNNLLH